MPLSLNQALDRALQTDNGLKAVGFDTLMVADYFHQAKSLRYPTLSLSAKARFINKLASIETPLFTKEIGSKETYQTDAQLSLPLFTGGKISSRIVAGRENLEATRAQFGAARIETAYRCRKAYFSVMAAGAMVKSTQSSLERLRLIRQDVANLFSAGLADSLDILEAASAFEMGNRSLTDARTAELNAADALGKIVGMTNPEVTIIPIEHPAPPQKPDVIALSGQMIARPELQQMLHAISAKQASISGNKALYFPDIVGFAGYSYGKPNQDMFNKTWNDYFSAGVTLNWSFNLGGQTSKGVRAAESAVSSARMSYNDLEENLKLQARVSLNEFAKGYDQFEIASREFELAGRKFDLAKKKQKEGHLSVNRLLELEADLTASERRLEAARIAFYLAENDYLYAIGSDRLFGGIR